MRPRIVLLALLVLAAPSAGAGGSDPDCGPDELGLDEVCVRAFTNVQNGCYQSEHPFRVTCFPFGTTGGEALARERDALGMGPDLCLPGELEVYAVFNMSWNYSWTHAFPPYYQAQHRILTFGGEDGWGGVDDCSQRSTWDHAPDPRGFGGPCGECTMTRVELTIAWTVDAWARLDDDTAGIPYGHDVASGSSACVFLSMQAPSCVAT